MRIKGKHLVLISLREQLCVEAQIRSLCFSLLSWPKKAFFISLLFYVWVWGDSWMASYLHRILHTHGAHASALCEILRMAMHFYEYIYPLPDLSISIQAIHRSPSNTFSIRLERLILSSCQTQPSNNQPDHHAQTCQNRSASPFGRHCDAAVPRDRDLRFYHGNRANLRDKRPKGCHGAIRRQGLGELRFPNLHLISRR